MFLFISVSYTFDLDLDKKMWLIVHPLIEGFEGFSVILGEGGMLLHFCLVLIFGNLINLFERKKNIFLERNIQLS